MAAEAQQTVIVSLPLDAPDRADYSRGVRQYWLTTEYAATLYDELRRALFG